jgi:hypothetical protein
MIRQSNIQVYGIIIVFVLLAGVLLLPSATAGTDINTVDDLVDEDLETLDNKPSSHSTGDLIGNSRIMVTVNYRDGSFDTLSSEPINLFLGSQTFVRSEKEIEDIKFRVDFNMDNFDLTATTADFVVVACPVSEYCDNEGSSSAVILCGDETSCDIGFDKGSPYVILNPSDYPELSQWEEPRLVLKADWITVELVSKVDSKKYTAVLGCQAESLCGHWISVDLEKGSSSVATQDGGEINVEESQYCNPFCEDDLDIGDILKLSNGVDARVETVTPRADGLCEFTFMPYDRSVRTGECP